MNSIQLIGRLTKDPQVSSINVNGASKKVAKYILAVERKSSDGVDYIPCSVIDKGANWAENNIKKGTRIGVVGSLRINLYEKNGFTVYKPEIIVSEQYFA